MTEREVPPETEPVPEADAHEQRLPVVEGGASDDRTAADPEEPDVPDTELPPELPGDADPADAYEQARSVDFDEDDYR